MCLTVVSLNPELGKTCVTEEMWDIVLNGQVEIAAMWVVLKYQQISDIYTNIMN